MDLETIMLGTKGVITYSVLVGTLFGIATNIFSYKQIQKSLINYNNSGDTKISSTDISQIMHNLLRESYVNNPNVPSLIKPFGELLLGSMFKPGEYLGLRKIQKDLSQQENYEIQ